MCISSKVYGRRGASTSTNRLKGYQPGVTLKRFPAYDIPLFRAPGRIGPLADTFAPPISAPSSRDFANGGAGGGNAGPIRRHPPRHLGTPHVFARTEATVSLASVAPPPKIDCCKWILIGARAPDGLAEVFGPDWVEADREARIAGHTAYAPRAFAKLPQRWQRKPSAPMPPA